MTTAIKQHSPDIFIFTALSCEAKPIVKFLGLTKTTAVSAFEVFVGSDICLVVTGCGSAAMAAAVAYSQAWFKPSAFPVMLNVGIAGHSQHAIGSIFLIAKTIDADSGKSGYPPLAFSPPCFTESLQTVAKPQLDYPLPCLYDMEASAFFETASRFSSGELVHSVKVVSDNETHSADAINAKQVTALIAGNMAVITAVLEQLSVLRANLPATNEVQFEQLLQRYRLTVSQQHRLKQLLARLSVLSGARQVPIDSGIVNGKELLLWLEDQAKQQPVVL